MREYPYEIEADLLEHFGIDLLDLYRGKLSLRRVYVLMDRLISMPGRSALSRAIDPQAEWDTNNFLTAELIDRLDLSNWLMYRANFEDSGDMPMPKPFPRPGHKEEEPAIEFASNEEIAKALAFNF